MTLVLLLLLTSALKAQTKEETISWLREKLEKYLEGENAYESNIKLASLNECEFVVTFHFKNSYYDLDATVTMPTNIKSIGDEGILQYDSEVVKLDYGQNGISYSHQSRIVKIRKGEDNIYERITKALQHLATFCPKKKEAF